MNVCILRGSPRKNGNTNTLLEPFVKTLRETGCTCLDLDLHTMTLEPCVACRCCQQDWEKFNCSRKDDLQQVFDAVLASDLIVLATPIYSWFCTPPMKIALDRLVYGMNKIYSTNPGPRLWEGKSVAMVITCGYRPEKGADLFEEAMIRYCKHSRLNYRGMLAERHLGYHTEFMDEEKAQHARDFAKKLLTEAEKEA